MTAKRISTGILAGTAYTLFVWAAAWLGLFEWIQKEHLQDITINSLLAPFSCLSIFVFFALYGFHKGKKATKRQASFSKNGVIIIAFCLAATLVQFPLLYLDGIHWSCIYVTEIAFFLCSFLVALLTNAFYLFLFGK